MDIDTCKNRLLPYMKGVGVGKSGARSLDRESARQAMLALLAGDFHPVTFGAFFMGLRYKGESPEELAGFLDAMNQHTLVCRKPAPDGLLNCAGAYDGKARTINVSIPAALVAVAAGVPVALHGARDIPTKHGMTNGHVVQALGVNLAASVEDAGAILHQAGITFVEQVIFHPALHSLLEMRNQMGKRTILNTMETLSNPFGARSHLGGFFHDAYAELIGNALNNGCTAFERATFVKGIEGSDELRPGVMYLARIVEGSFSIESVDSEKMGLPVHISDLSAPAGDVDQRTKISAGRILDLLEAPDGDSSFRNAVLLNGAVRLYAGNRTMSLGEAIALAEDALSSGRAGEVLKRWKTVSAAHSSSSTA